MRLCQPDTNSPPLMSSTRTGPLSRPLSRGCPHEVSQRKYDLCEVAERAARSREDRSPLAQDATGSDTAFSRGVNDRGPGAASRQEQPRCVFRH
jgi:hypothetical protein